jgi:hypothetical protein
MQAEWMKWIETADECRRFFHKLLIGVSLIQIWGRELN